MNTLLRNFFYSVGLVLLATAYGLDPATVQSSDLVRLVQSPNAQQAVAVLTIVLVVIDFLFHREAGASTADVMPLKLSSADSARGTTSKSA